MGEESAGQGMNEYSFIHLIEPIDDPVKVPID